jgi:hypothetical protein
MALVAALMLASCGGGSGSYSPPPTSTSKNEANLMRSERGAPAKRSKREDPIETYQRPYPG